MKNLIIAVLACVVVMTTMAATGAERVARESYNSMVERANIAVDRHDWVLAESIYSLIEREYPDHKQLPMVLSNKSIVQSNQEHFADALATLDKALALDSTNTSILDNRATLRSNMGDMAGARADFERIVTLDPQNVYAAFYAGSLALQEGDTITAKRCFEALRAASPSSEAAHKAWAAYYTKVKDYAASVAEYDALVKMKPEVETYLGRAANCLMLDRLDEASIDIAEAMRLDPRDGEAYLLRAALNKKRYELDAAKADGRKAIELGVSARRVEALLGE